MSSEYRRAVNPPWLRPDRSNWNRCLHFIWIQIRKNRPYEKIQSDLEELISSQSIDYDMRQFDVDYNNIMRQHEFYGQDDFDEKSSSEEEEESSR